MVTELQSAVAFIGRGDGVPTRGELAAATVVAAMRRERAVAPAARRRVRGIMVEL